MVTLSSTKSNLFSQPPFPAPPASWHSVDMPAPVSRWHEMDPIQPRAACNHTAPSQEKSVLGWC